MPISAAIVARLQCVPLAGASCAVFASILSLTFRDKRFFPLGRISSRNRAWEDPRVPQDRFGRAGGALLPVPASCL